MAPKKSSLATFEKQLSDLEQIVDNLEDGELSLEESMTQFEKGIKLTKDCQNILGKAEQKVKILLENSGTSELEEFDED